MQKLYRSQAASLVRVVQGVPISWSPNIANMGLPGRIYHSTWSPCGKFIAISLCSLDKVRVLDAVTLVQLYTVQTPGEGDHWGSLSFSPGSNLLTGNSTSLHSLITWDLQTGGIVSKIDMTGMCFSMIYSGCGAKLGVLFGELSTSVCGLIKHTINTYNIISGTQIFSCSVPGIVHSTMWIFGECLQFAVTESGSISIWGINFTSSSGPTWISSFPTPDGFLYTERTLLPALSLFAFIFGNRIMVWDTQNQKFLLESPDIKDPATVSFSPDGKFVICGTMGSVIHLWKKSPNGYLPHQRLISSSRGSLITSPDGESILSYDGSMVQLWHIIDIPTTSIVCAQASEYTEGLLLEFSPDESLVAVTYQWGSTVTILDVRSGNPQLVINTGTRNCGIRITENKLIVVGNGEILTWELPIGDCILSAQETVNNSVQNTTFRYATSTDRLYASISPNLKYIALKTLYGCLSICNLNTGEELAVSESEGYLPGFTQDSNGVWCFRWDGKVDQWAIINDQSSDVTKLEKLGEAQEALTGFPWHSSHGYKITNHGWVLSSNGKQLLWLPHQWSSMEMRWGGRFLALFPKGVLEAIILELDV